MRCGTGLLAAGLMIFAFLPPAHAYLASGDRVFVPTVVLPQQIAPGNDFYMWGSNQPLVGGADISEFNGTITKQITERLGVTLDDIWTRTGIPGAGPNYGFLNLDGEIKYLAVYDKPHEFLLSVGLDHEFGGTGAVRTGAFNSSANTPRIYFGKGLGDLDIGYLRPLAITGLVGYQLADTAPRPNQVQAGVSIQYSIPYLELKVQSLRLPEPLRGLSPITEIFFTVPGTELRLAHDRPDLSRRELRGRRLGFPGRGAGACIPGHCERRWRGRAAALVIRLPLRWRAARSAAVSERMRSFCKCARE